MIDRAVDRETGDASGPTVAVTGGTGFVGSHLRVALRENPVVLLGRREPGLGENERWVRMDMAEQIPPGTLDGCEELCHLAYAVNEGGENVLYNQHLLDAVNAQPKIRRVILISTTSVYGASDARVVDEMIPCRPEGDYEKTKLACETVWREGLRRDCDLIVLRPSQVIGPGGKGLLNLIRDALHRPVVAAIKRSLLYHRPLHLVAVRNVVAAIRFCLNGPPKGARETYIVSDGRQSYAAVQDTVRSIVGRRPLPGFAMPRWTLPFLGALLRRRFIPEQKFSSRKLREAGFEDEVSLFDEVKRLVQSVEKAGDRNLMHNSSS